MSTLKVNSIANNGSAVDLPNGAFNIGGNSILQGYTSSATEPASPSTGDFWWDSTNELLYQYLNSEFKAIGIAAAAGKWYGDRGIVSNFQSATNTIEYYDITTTGNASDFGDTTASVSRRGSCSDGSRGLIAGGQSPVSNVIEYITTSSTGNATDFGDLSVARDWISGVSDGTFGLFAGGTSSGDTIDYVTIQTTGNAQDFGNLTSARWQPAGWSDATYGVFCGGNYNASNIIDYVTIASPGNATDFGDLTAGRGSGISACGDTTRTIVAGGTSGGYTNILDYITTASPGNATDFGDLLAGNAAMAACSNATYACWCGGEVSGNTIQYVTIQTTGNAQDFGDLITTGYGLTGLSGSPS
jgi:hypothetical protein